MKDTTAVFVAMGSGVHMILNCVSLEVFTAVKLRIPVLWNVTGSVHLTFEMNLPCDTVSHPIRPES